MGMEIELYSNQSSNNCMSPQGQQFFFQYPCYIFTLSVSIGRIDSHSILYDCTVGLLIIDAANYTFDPLPIFIPTKYTITYE